MVHPKESNVVQSWTTRSLNRKPNLGDVLNNILLKNQKSYWKILVQKIGILKYWKIFEDWKILRRPGSGQLNIGQQLWPLCNNRSENVPVTVFFGSLDSKQPTSCNLVAQILIGGFIIPTIAENFKNV